MAEAASHRELTSRDEFLKALDTKDRYVLLYCYSGEVPPQAAEAAKRHADTTDAYRVDIDKFPSAKDNLKLTEFPAIVVFRDSKEIKRAEGLTPEKSKEIAAILV